MGEAKIQAETQEEIQAGAEVRKKRLSVLP